MKNTGTHHTIAATNIECRRGFKLLLKYSFPPACITITVNVASNRRISIQFDVCFQTFDFSFLFFPTSIGQNRLIAKIRTASTAAIKRKLPTTQSGLLPIFTV